MAGGRHRRESRYDSGNQNDTAGDRGLWLPGGRRAYALPLAEQHVGDDRERKPGSQAM